MTVSHRPAGPDDEAFLRSLLEANIPGSEFWPEPIRAQLIGMQVNARRQSLKAAYPDAPDRIITIDGQDAGWLLVADREDEVHLAEILIAAPFRGKGAGAESVRRILEAAGGKPVRLHVDILNVGAVRLYTRLGFERVGGDEVRLLMEKG